MKNTFTCLFILMIVHCYGYAQSSTDHPSILYINAIIDYNGNIKVRNNMLKLDEVTTYARNYIRKQPAFKYDQVVYRVYADEHLELGAIMNLEQALQKAFEGKRERYLLDTKNIILDEPDMWDKLKTLEIKAVND